MLKLHPEESIELEARDIVSPAVKDAVVKINGLTKRYRGKAVVDKLSLSIPRGSVYLSLIHI